jgi:prolyl-tRNA editing enzyme YbaK/EbsC (Cys-tRNA(Pro) deacylase)
VSASIDRVRAALAEAGLAPEIRSFPAGTRTAQDAAAAIGVQVGQIVKSLIFARASGGAVLVLASGTNRVDEARVGERIGEAISRADADLVRSTTGYAIGGVPPLGHAQPLLTLIDEDLLTFEEVWAAAGTPRDVFAIAPADLVRATGGEVGPVSPGS